MNSTIILKKEDHWYVLPEFENRNETILSIVKNENPQLDSEADCIADMLDENGWSVEEYRDFSVVA